MGNTIISSNMSGKQASGMGISIDMIPSPVIIVAAFDKLGLDIRSFKEPLTRSIKNVLAPSIRQNFEVGGRPEWQELSEATTRQKPSHKSEPLIRDGALKRRASSVQTWDIDGMDGTAVLKVGDDVWYGIVHQEGSGESFEGGVLDRSGGGVATTKVAIFGSGRGYVPQRVWALFQDEDVDEVEKVFEEWMQERVEASLWR